MKQKIINIKLFLKKFLGKATKKLIQTDKHDVRKFFMIAFHRFINRENDQNFMSLHPKNYMKSEEEQS